MPKTIFVSDARGNDANNGLTSGTSKKTIYSAHLIADADDTIEILDSNTYQPGSDDDNPSGNGRIQFSNTIHFVASSGQNPIFKGTGARASGQATKEAFGGINMSPGEVITFQGITFDDFRSTDNTIVRTTTAGGGAPTVQYTDCTFQAMNGSPIFVDPAPSSESKPNLLDRCEIKDGCNEKIIDATVGSEHMVIQNCILHNTASHTAQRYVDMGSNASADTIIRNCTVIVDRVTGVDVIRMGVVENIIVKNVTTASVSGGAQNVNPNLVGINARSSYSNNCVNGSFGNSAGKGAIQDNTGAGATDGGGNITGAGSDPLFVNESSFPDGLELKAGSPCRNTGKTIAALTVDFNGNPRPIEGAYDIGALEFVYWMSNDGQEGGGTKFGPKDFEIRDQKNRLATQKFPRASLNRQAPFFMTLPGPPTLRRRKTPYKNET